MRVKVDYLPVFKPNEFFWEHHWKKDSGEEKWEAFARVTREIMAKEGGFGLSELRMEDKNRAKDELKKWKLEQSLNKKLD